MTISGAIASSAGAGGGGWLVRLGGELSQNRLKAILGVLGRQVLGGGAGSFAGAPDDRAPGRAPAAVPDVRRAERPAELTVGSDLEMPRGAM